MSGLLGTHAGLVQDITLVLQISIMFLLGFGYYLVRKKHIQNHGVITTIALLLHTSNILLTMLPSFMNILNASFDGLSFGVMVTYIHGILGIVAEMLGLWVVINWRFQSIVLCAKRKVFMKVTFVSWFLSLILGITFYAYYYI